MGPCRSWFLVSGPCSHLVAVHHEVVRGDEGFEDHDPAVAGGALQQRVCQVGDADVQLIGAVNQVWKGGGAEQRKHGVNAAAACPHATFSSDLKQLARIHFRAVIKVGSHECPNQ